MANAQELENGGGVDLVLFRPAIDSKGRITVNGTEVLGHLDYAFGLILDAGIGMMPYRGFAEDDTVGGADAPRERDLVDVMVSGTFSFNLGIKNWLVLGVQLPVRLTRGAAVSALMNDGTPFYNGGTSPVRALSNEGIGDLTIHAKARLLRFDRHRKVGLAAIARLGVPTGKSTAFTGEPGVSLWPSLVLEWRPIQRLRISVEAGYRAIFKEGSEVNILGRTCPATFSLMGRSCVGGTGSAVDAVLVEEGTEIRYGDLMTFGAGLSARIASPVDLVLEAYGTQIVKHFQPEGLSVEGLLGFKFFVQENSYLIIAGGAGVPRRGIQNADYRATVGFVFEPSIGDADGDGIPDDVDQCPNDPEDFDGFEDEDGCPDPDNDRDGILDVDDLCPNDPEDFDGYEDEDGCPESNTGDRDGDGIPDDVDHCPDDPEDFDGFEDEDGCPDPDNDGDGIPDAYDLCPNDPEDIDFFEDEDGCPDPDNDRDGIPDEVDQCPDDPETYNGFEDEDGCPDEGSVILEDDQLLILDKIYFETNSAVIQRRSYAILDAIAATLRGNPQITLMEVQGHADERGNDDYNLQLTRDRAASVVEALVQRGVARDRLRSAGYGERCPIDPASNPRAWEANRRVEFKIVRTTAGPTGVTLACPAGEDLIPED
ncbi:MAG: OmpA family protein [Sandaracinaceae bacterium]|nr:OmpA family protein [Sandaracinaceae bacterium]